jgi:hypothetical protein
MTSPRTIGVGAGLLSTGVAVASNLQRGNPHRVSMAPDLLTLFIVVAVVWFAVRWAGGQPRVAGRDSARTATVAASAVSAIGMGAFTLWYLPSHALVLGALGAGSGFVFAYLAGTAASRATQKPAA